MKALSQFGSAVKVVDKGIHDVMVSELTAGGKENMSESILLE